MFSAKDITAPIVPRLWRTIKHSVRAERAAPPLETPFGLFFFWGGGGVGSGHIWGHIKIHMLR